MHKMLRRVISEDIALSIEPCADLAMVHADPGQIEQVIMNMSVNARDAMPGGGTLSLATQHVRVTPSDAGIIPLGDYVRLSVRDTGIGMNEETRRQIFEPFFTTKGPTRGTGLGLSTCYGIVQQSGGYIDVDTAPGRGTTFHVYLPQAQHVQPARPAARPAQSTRRGDETVLLVEDDELLRRALQRALSAAGYTVLCAGTMADAMALFAEVRDRLDLVLSDVVLPDESGIALMDRVHDAAPSVKTMLMSGHTDHALLAKHTFRVGSAFLQKPFHLSTLTDRVRDTLDAHAA
jgi:CheY-like chemotaxis protein